MKTENIKPSSLWRRAMKPAAAAFGFGCFVGIASFYRGPQDLPLVGRVALGLLIGFVFGTAFAGSTYLVALGLYWLKRSDRVAPVTADPKHSADGSLDKSPDGMGGLVVAGVCALFVILWIISKALPSSETARDRSVGAVTRPSGAKVDAQLANESQEPNLERALRTRAEAGEAEAQWQLGAYYDVSKNFVEAAKWYRRSAENGHVFAQYCLGWMYDQGLGVPQNFVEAFNWYSQSAGRGNALAQNNLGDLFNNGQLGARDTVRAYVFYSLAAAQGNTNARINRDNLARVLTPEQLAEGQRQSTKSMPLNDDPPRRWLR